MFLINQYRSTYHRRPWTTGILSGLFITLLLLTLFRMFLPLALEIGANSWLKSEGVEAKVFDINISLLDGTIKIYRASGQNNDGKGFKFEYLGIQWEWAPIFDRLIKINRIEIKSLNADAEIFKSGEVSLAGINLKSSTNETQSKPSDNPWDIDIENIILSDINMCVQQFTQENKIILDYCGKLENFNWRGNIGYEPSNEIVSTENVPVYIIGVMELSGIELLNNQLKRNLLSIGSIVVNNINIESLEDVRIDSIDVDNLSAMQRDNSSSSEDAQVFAFDRLMVQPVRLQKQKDIQLGKIELTGNRSYVVINKDGSLELKKWLPERDRPTVQVTQKTKISKADSDSFTFSFDELRINTKNHAVYIDNSLEQPFASNIHDIKLILTKLDSKSPENQSHVSLSLAIDKHGSFKMEADVNPLSRRPSVKGTGEISGVDLRVLTPYTKQYIGHIIKSGQLDSKLKIDVDNGAIDSKVRLTLHQFELKSISKKESEELNNKFGFPVNSSLSLLRDRDNAIRIDIPVSGDIENPDFDPKDAIVKATSKAITTAVLHYYTPFGLVFAAKSLFNLATALNFEPVWFDAGKSKLTSAHREQLDKLVTLMADRPGIHLTLCGISNLADRDKLFPGLVNGDESSQKKTANVNSLSRSNLDALLKLAELRSSSIKHYLVNEKTIKPSRLVECAPEYIPEKISGVEISI